MNYVTTSHIFKHSYFTDINYSEEFLADLATRKTLTWQEACELAATEFGVQGTTQAKLGYVDCIGVFRTEVTLLKRVAMGIVNKAKALGVEYIRKS